MINDADLKILADREPAASRTLDAIRSLSALAAELPLPAFLEPVSAVQLQPKKGGELIGVAADDLRSWCRHIAFRTRVRLNGIEGAIVHELARGQVLPAAILLRSHIEAAALATYCLETLSECARNDARQPLTDLMYKTLFGTSLNKFAGDDAYQATAALLSWVETRTIQITKAIAALDQYINPNGPRGEIAVLYSILCEFAHPNQRGTLDFASSVPAAGGWMIRYNLSDTGTGRNAAWLLSALLLSMRAGYSASEMLRAWDFDDGQPAVRWIWPSQQDGDRIWHTIIQPEPGAR